MPPDCQTTAEIGLWPFGGVAAANAASIRAISASPRASCPASRAIVRT